MKNNETETTDQRTVIVQTWLNNRGNTRYLDATERDMTQKENNFVMWLLAANNTDAAWNICQKPEVLRQELQPLVNETDQDPYIQTQYETCPEYINNRIEMVNYYRQKIHDNHMDTNQQIHTLKTLEVAE